MDGKGNYTYSLNNASDDVQALHAGQNVADTFYVTITDSEGGVSAPVKVEVSITGTNDAPLLNLEKVRLLREGQTESDSGMASIIDKDAGDVLTYKVAFEGKEEFFEKGSDKNSATIQGKYGILTLDADGKYTYELTSHALGEGEKADEKFTITVADESGATVSKDLTVSIVGANDAPVITIEAFEQGPNGSSLAYSDADAKDTLSLWVKYNSTEIEVKPLASDATTGTAVIAGLGTFTFSRTADTGAWTTYTFVAESVLAAAIRDGQYGDAITVAMGVSDGHGSTVYVNTAVQVEGTNVAPTAVDVDNGLLFGHVTAINNEHSDVLSFQGDTSGSHLGVMHMHTDGSYEYTLGKTESTLGTLRKAYDTSSDGHVHDQFGFSVTDGHETSTEATHSGSLSIDLHNGAQLDAAGGQLLFANGNLTGTEHNDVILGGSHDDVLYGGGGDDILYGGAGRNELYGGDGNDTLYAGNAGDHLYGGAGNDHLYGGADSDFLDGGANTFAADGGGNHLYGGAGDDVLVFHKGDAIDGGIGTDMLVVKGGSVDELFTGAEHAKGVDGITGVEVMVSASGSALENLTDMAAIATKAGVSINKGSDGSAAVSFDTSHTWVTTTQAASDGTTWDVHSTTITIDNAEQTVQVAVQHLTTNQGG